jgi:hypothetical protein
LSPLLVLWCASGRGAGLVGIKRDTVARKRFLEGRTGDVAASRSRLWSLLGDVDIDGEYLEYEYAAVVGGEVFVGVAGENADFSFDGPGTREAVVVIVSLSDHFIVGCVSCWLLLVVIEDVGAGSRLRLETSGGGGVVEGVVKRGRKRLVLYVVK